MTKMATKKDSKIFKEILFNQSNSNFKRKDFKEPLNKGVKSPLRLKITEDKKC